jgi:hypothetical protein
LDRLRFGPRPDKIVCPARPGRKPFALYEDAIVRRLCRRNGSTSTAARRSRRWRRERAHDIQSGCRAVDEYVAELRGTVRALLSRDERDDRRRNGGTNDIERDDLFAPRRCDGFEANSSIIGGLIAL